MKFHLCLIWLNYYYYYFMSVAISPIWKGINKTMLSVKYLKLMHHFEVLLMQQHRTFLRVTHKFEKLVPEAIKLLKAFCHCC